MPPTYPSRENQLKRLSRIEGQIAGIRKMIEEQRYCIDIVAQIKAVTGAMKQVQLGALNQHLHHCVKESLASDNPKYFSGKVEEIVHVLGRME